MTWQGTTVSPILGRCDFEILAAEFGFRRGDANADSRVDISDAIMVLGCKFTGTECPGCRDAADFNDDGQDDISDPIAILNFLFLGTWAPPAPGMEFCGPDPTEDSLPPCDYPAC